MLYNNNILLNKSSFEKKYLINRFSYINKNSQLLHIKLFVKFFTKSNYY